MLARMQRYLAYLVFIIFLSSCGSSEGDNRNLKAGSSIGYSESDSTSEIDSNINRLVRVALGGVDQGILMQGNDSTKPVLLVLHGGPGYAMMPLMHENNTVLEDHFIVVNWDQLGAGLSYSPAISEERISLAQLISDARELTTYLKTEFNQQKIYLMGHSFGTVLAMYMVEQAPDDYYAIASVGQVVNVIENEQLSYDFALEASIADGNVLAVEALSSVGRPDDDGEYQVESGYEVTAQWMAYYGGDLYGKTSTDEIEQAILNSDIYKEYQQQWLDGWELSQSLFNDTAVWEFDFRTDLPSIDVPVYFLTGRHDYDTPFVLVNEYYQLLSAPKKELIWFESSAHFPFYEEPELFNQALIDRFQHHNLD